MTEVAHASEDVEQGRDSNAAIPGKGNNSHGKEDTTSRGSASLGTDADGYGPQEDEDDDEVLPNHRFELLFKKFVQEPITVRVHDVKIHGNTRTHDSAIEAQFEQVKKAKTTRELLQAVTRAKNHLESMGVFDKCIIALEAGPVELPGTANVIVLVEEAKSLSSFELGVMTRPETKSSNIEASINWKNLLGYFETLDTTGSYGWDGTFGISAGFHYPHFKGLPATFVTRASVLTQDWRKYASFKEQLVGLSVGLVTDEHHDVSYNLTWRNLQDPDHMSSRSIRRQLGHALLSSIKYTFKIDERDSFLRPTSGYAFRSATQLAGIGPNNKFLRFIRQELDLRCAIPLGFYNSALNFGVSGGLVMPWGEGFRRQVTAITDRFFMGGHSSLVCDMNGPATLLGFRSRGVGPTDGRRATTLGPNESIAEPRDTLGGDLAVTGFMDLSFDIPLSLLREQNIHGHCFTCVGNLFGLNEVDRQSLSWQKFWSSFRCSAGVGLVIPTELFRLEVNYCQILRQFGSDRCKRGIQFSLSSPR